MTHRSVLSCLVASLVLAGTGLSAAEDTARGRRVTDPNELAQHGLAPDAILYIAPGAETIQGPGGAARDEQAARKSLRSAERRFHWRPARFAIFNAANLRPERSTTEVQAVGFLGYHNIDPVVGPHYLQLQLPDRVRLEGLRWWAVNQKFQGDQESMGMQVYEHCLPAFAAGPPVITLLAQAGTDFALGEQSGFIDFSPDIVVNNATCTYTFTAVYERFYLPEEIFVQRVRAQYRY